MATGEFVLGLAMLMGVIALAVAAAVLVVRRRLGHLAATPRQVAVGVVATVALIAMHQVPLMLGVLTRGTVLLCGVLLVAGAAALGRAGGGARPAEPAPAAPASSKLSWVVALLGTGATIAAALAVLVESRGTAVAHIDYMEFHGPAVASWIDSGSLWPVVLFEPWKWSGYYPNSGDVVLLAGALPWHSDLVARWTPLPWFALTVLALYALASELGAPRATALLTASAVVAMPAVSFFTFGGAMPDVVLFAGFSAALLFLLRHWRHGRRSDLVLAALGLGLAVGTKWYGLPAAGAVGLVWVASRALARERAGRIARDALTVAGVVLAVGGVWLVRNAIATGNPLQPLGLSIGPLTLLPSPPDPVREQLGARILDYATDPAALWDIGRDAVRLALRPVGVLGVAALVAAAVLAARRRHGPALAGVAVALIVGVVYLATPYSAQGPPGDPGFAWVNTRYGVPALLIGAVLAAWAARYVGPRRRWLLEAVALLAVLDAARASVRGPFFRVEADSLAIAVALAGCALGFALLVRRTAAPRRARVAGIGIGVVAAGLIAGAAVSGERVLDRGRYASIDPAIGWIERNAPEERRIGMTGQWQPSDWHPIFALFGPRFGNDVRFIAARRRGTLVEHTRRAPFVAELRRHRIDVLVATPAARAAIAWSRTVGFEPVVRSGRLVVLERGGRERRAGAG